MTYIEFTTKTVPEKWMKNKFYAPSKYAKFLKFCPLTIKNMSFFFIISQKVTKMGILQKSIKRKFNVWNLTLFGPFGLSLSWKLRDNGNWSTYIPEALNTIQSRIRVMVMIFNTTFNHISDI
jgi:hypothetical protein